MSESESEPTYISCRSFDHVFEGVQQLIDQNASEIHLVARLETMFKPEDHWENIGWYNEYIQLDEGAIKFCPLGGRTIIADAYAELLKNTVIQEKSLHTVVDVCVTDDISKMISSSSEDV